MPVLLVISNVTYLTLEFLLQTKFNLHFRFFQNLTVNASMVILNDLIYLKVARFSATSMSLHSLNTIHTSSARAYFAGTKTHNGLCQKSIAHNLTKRHASFACWVYVVMLMSNGLLLRYSSSMHINRTIRCNISPFTPPMPL